MKLRKLLVYIPFLLGLVFLLHNTTASATTNSQIEAIQKRGVLKVGVKQDVPNFGYYSAKTQKYEGMEVDLGKKIADSLKVKVEYVPVTTQTREPLMDNGQIDILIGTYTITPERQASYSISKPYYYDEIGFLVRKSSDIHSIKDLNNKTIGVSQGATTKANLESYGKDHNLNFQFVQLGSFPELAVSLYAKRIDAFSVDKSILSGYVSKETRILKDGFNTQEYGIATKKSNTQLITYINDLLDKWTKDGSLNQLYHTYDLKPAKADK